VNQSHTARKLAMLVLLGVGVAACSSASHNSAATTASPNDGRAASQPPASNGSGATNATTPIAKASGNGTGFCKLEADSFKKAQAGATSNGGTTPTALRRQYATLRHDEQPAIDSAPGELRSDLNLLLNASVKYGDALAKVDYDMRRAAGASAAFNTPEVHAASTHVLTYLKDTCGIDLTGGAATATATSTP